MDLNVTHNFYEIISGTDNMATQEYMEAVKDMSSDKNKISTFIKRFMDNIENVVYKKISQDKRIASSKGDLKKFVAYNNINSSMEFLNKNIPGLELMKDLKMIKSKLEEYESLYIKGYDKQIRLITLEYENAVYILTTGLALTMANSLDFEIDKYSIQAKKKTHTMSHKVTKKAIEDLASQLHHFKHKEYLEALIKAVDNKDINTSIEESTYVESVVSDTIDLLGVIINNVERIGSLGMSLFNNIKNTLFGIIPIIRTIVYLRYKKKADSILFLEQAMNDIEKNIIQLKNKSNMDEKQKAEIIKKQRVIIEQYRKRCEKLKAELFETEKEAVVEIDKTNKDIKDGKSQDDDFVLEGVDLSEIFGESTRQF